VADFKIVLQKTLPHEGFYSNRSADRGGETYAGISRKYWPGWRGWGIIDRAKPLKQGERVANKQLDGLIEVFYYENFWRPIRGADVKSQSVCNFMFDWGVNSGSAATRRVQRVVGVACDGVVGPVTIQAINTCDPVDLLTRLKASRTAFVHAIVRSTPAQAVNLNGWMRRIDSF